MTELHDAPLFQNLFVSLVLRQLFANRLMRANYPRLPIDPLCIANGVSLPTTLTYTRRNELAQKGEIPIRYIAGSVCIPYRTNGSRLRIGIPKAHTHMQCKPIIAAVAVWRSSRRGHGDASLLRRQVFLSCLVAILGGTLLMSNIERVVLKSRDVGVFELG
jgi:hypothetical protein